VRNQILASRLQPIYNPAATRRPKVTEDELIHRIARAVPSVAGRHKSGVRLGIGDDAAILSSRRRFDWVVSCDAFMEGVHFLPQIHSADSVGYKALARAASDLAAMGAVPRLFLLTLALPANRTGAWLDGFLGGMARAARLLAMCLIGGDTTTGTAATAALTVFGQVKAGMAVTRSGAHPGDLIYVSGTLGRAQFGLELVRARGRKIEKRKGKIGRELVMILRPHLYPRIRVKLGSWLAENRIASAMIDLSDGLSTDLTRLCRASGVGAKLWADRIPRVSIPATSAGLKTAALHLNLEAKGLRIPSERPNDALQMALHGGDDYELLFTVSRRNKKKLRRAPGFAKLTCIGEIVRLRSALTGPATRDRPVSISIVPGRDEAGQGTQGQPLQPGGWDPFR
jgi:thiamine-monophosphate kinase